MRRVVALLVALAGVQAAAGHAKTPERFCGPATPVDRSAPIGRAVRLGDLVWLGVYPYSPGYPTKVVVLAQRDLRAAFVVTGRSCATGERLRFWYRDSLPFAQVPVSTAQLRTTGTLSVRFGPWRAKSMTGGYFHFWASGRWKIVARVGGRVVATSIVTAASG